MSSKKGTIAIMGSGELTTSMVEVHKKLIADLSVPAKAVFLDTPAGFQLNVGQLSNRACEFFRTHVQQSMAVASFKSCNTTTSFEAETAFQTLREAGFILVGPGSPTYAVRQWKETPIPDIIVKRIEAGACLVVSSAAALTVGRLTLPVYEIYKVGEDLHWVEGIDVLGHFGLNLVVIPHWNNAEGGTHDTRFCYMGEPKFRALEDLLPPEVSILGLDEHTAILIDFEKSEAQVKGIGRVTLRSQRLETTFEKGDLIPIEVLRGKPMGRKGDLKASQPPAVTPASDSEGGGFWDEVHAIQNAFHDSLEKNESKGATNALLALDGAIWKAQRDLENEEFISQAREILREMIVLLGLRLESSPCYGEELLAPLVEALLDIREGFRRNKKWNDADLIREKLQGAGIIVEDTNTGPRWRVSS